MRLPLRLSSRLSLAALVGSLACGLPPTGLSSVCLAKTIKLPEANPVLAFEVPDDWTTAPAEGGLELRAPDRTAIMVMGMVKRTKNDLTAWQKAATKRMIDFGVKFDPNAKAPHKSANNGSTNNGAGTPVGPQSRPAEAAGTGAAPTAPAATPPGQAAAPATQPTAAKDAGGKDAAGKDTAGKPGDKPAQASAPLRFRSALVYGATLAGKPVDVEFLNYALNKDVLFVVQQESGASDDRTATAIKSIRLTVAD